MAQRCHENKTESLTGRLQAKEATAGNDRVKALNDPAAEHGVSQPILHRLHPLANKEKKQQQKNN